MQRDEQRVRRVVEGMRKQDLQMLVCAAPENVLMLSGYWPVTGASIAIIDDATRVVLLVPSDEQELARHGWADEVRPYAAASLEDLRTTPQAMASALEKLLRPGVRVGYEQDPVVRPASYVAQHFFGDAITHACPNVMWVGADGLLATFRSALTPREIEAVRISTDTAQAAFRNTVDLIEPGISEAEVACLLQRALLPVQLDLDVHRAFGFAYCMSGPNAYEAFAAYQRSRSRKLQRGDLVLVHCNSCVDGFWTDITRTFVLDEPDERQRRMFEAIFEAREAALRSIKPGVLASDVDTATRQTMARRGFEQQFKHPTGHGVGFSAINHSALPRIHPKSTDVLEPGMCFNVEPGIYIEGYGGTRHCDMVFVTRDGYELLTPILSAPESVHLP